MTDRSLLVRALWFLAVGWWVTPILVNTAWAVNATVILAPLGIKLMNLVPTALTLREPQVPADPGAEVTQTSIVIRAVYFLLVGWWASWLWANVAALLAVTIIGLPIAIWMFNRLPYVTSLYRFDGRVVEHSEVEPMGEREANAG